MRKSACLVSVLLWCISCRAQEGARIAVFDPQTTSTSPRMDASEMNAVAQTLEGAGLRTARVTTAQIEETTSFGADRFDVLVMRGDTVPREDFPAIQKFASEGGVLVALAARAIWTT